jgi:hypothetical protein
MSAREWQYLFKDKVLLDQRVLDSGSGPGHALFTSGDLFLNRMERFESLRPEAR